MSSQLRSAKRPVVCVSLACRVPSESRLAVFDLLLDAVSQPSLSTAGVPSIEYLKNPHLSSARKPNLGSSTEPWLCKIYLFKPSPPSCKIGVHTHLTAFGGGRERRPHYVLGLRGCTY